MLPLVLALSSWTPHPCGVHKLHATSTSQFQRSGYVSAETETVSVARSAPLKGAVVPTGALSQTLDVEQSKMKERLAAAESAAGNAISRSGDAMEDYWDRSRGKPLRRSLSLWSFSMVATWKVLRAWKDESKQAKVAGWVRDELLRLGPTMIKLGQVASARTDLLSQPYIDALVALQDSVPTISAARVEQIVDEELGKPAGQVFDTFDPEPIAGASLGQVHRATLDGKPVAVKVQRRNLKELFDTDFRNIRLMARIGNFIEKRAQRKAGVSSRDWLKYTDDAARLLYLEIDYLNEASNARKFASSMSTEADVVVPKVFDNATTTRLLTMEYVRSVKMTDKEALESLGLDRRKLSKKVVDTFLTQLLKSGVLHCDPHPGNMCVDAKGRLVFYDFGMLDSFEPQVQQGMRNAAFALFGGSTDPSVEELRTASVQLVEGVQQMGFVDKAADPLALRKVAAFAVKNFKDQAAGRATEDVTEKVGGELQSMVDDGVIQFPSIFTFVGRAFASVDGLGRELDPDYDFRKLTEPYVGEIISERYQQEAAASRAAFFDGFKSVAAVPSRLEYVEGTVRAIEAGELVLTSRSLEQERGVKALEKRIGGLQALLVASTLLNLALGAATGPMRRLSFVAAAFFGMKALPSVLR